MSHFWKDAGDVVLPEMKVRCGMEIIVFDGTYRSFPNSIHLLKTTDFLAAESDEIKNNPHWVGVTTVFNWTKPEVFWVKSLLLLIG